MKQLKLSYTDPRGGKVMDIPRGGCVIDPGGISPVSSKHVPRGGKVLDPPRGGYVIDPGRGG
ncbi:hypothetical protein [Bacillus weihaiensis]|uniref:hypothetical protein n=1 Tax=Bacillus weihaiensis TaxID=1547283 RepID=UPI00235351DB|nr:hypothetical protein [Bacillus weihaiensis]